MEFRVADDLLQELVCVLFRRSLRHAHIHAPKVNVFYVNGGRANVGIPRSDRVMFECVGVTGTYPFEKRSLVALSPLLIRG